MDPEQLEGEIPEQPERAPEESHRRFPKLTLHAVFWLLIAAVMVWAFEDPIANITGAILGLGIQAAFATLMLVFALAMPAILFWYLFRIVLPGILRYRRLRQIRFYRASRRL